jgi:hypothetical protein
LVKDGTFMPVRYDRDTRAKAIRLVREHAGDYPSEYAAIMAVARRLGMSPETLRTWSRTSWKAGPSAYGMIVERPDAAEKMCGMPGVPVGGHRGCCRRHRSQFPGRSRAGVTGKSSLAAADAPAGTQTARAGPA